MVTDIKRDLKTILSVIYQIVRDSNGSKFGTLKNELK
jgi:hypothetical protein